MDPESTQEMMHIPPLTEILERMDTRLRVVASIVASSAENARAAGSADTEPAMELLRAGLRWLERLADHNRHFRRTIAPHDSPLSTRLQFGFDNAVGALRALDEKQFRRRSTLHSFDKSHAEGIYGCMLALGDVLFRAAEKSSTFDRDIFGKIYAKILANPSIPELLFVGATHTANEP